MRSFAIFAAAALFAASNVQAQVLLTELNGSFTNLGGEFPIRDPDSVALYPTWLGGNWANVSTLFQLSTAHIDVPQRWDSGSHFAIAQDLIQDDALGGYRLFHNAHKASVEWRFTDQWLDGPYDWDCCGAALAFDSNISPPDGATLTGTGYTLSAIEFELDSWNVHAGPVIDVVDYTYSLRFYGVPEPATALALLGCLPILCLSRTYRRGTKYRSSG